MRLFLKKILSPLLQKASALYLAKPRKYTYKGISVMVVPTVFPPFVTISTKLLLEFIGSLSISGKTFLELGCGCGIISILAAKKGAKVTATDINEVALAALQQNAWNNCVEIEIKHSDLFANLQQRQFDHIVINPPYYPKTPQSVAEQAWFCGENFEYFERLFLQLANYLNHSSVYMILSEDCELEKIKAIANKNAMAFELVLKKSVAGEANYIFKLVSL